MVVVVVNHCLGQDLDVQGSSLVPRWRVLLLSSVWGRTLMSRAVTLYLDRGGCSYQVLWAGRCCPGKIQVTSVAVVGGIQSSATAAAVDEPPHRSEQRARYTDT